MRGLALCGLIALAFGLGAIQATDSFGWFSIVNLAGGGAALLAAAVLGLRRARGAGAPAFRGTLVAGVGRVTLALLAAVALERGAAALDVQLDWTFERRYELSDAVQGALQELCGSLEVSLYFDDFDPRIRSTRTLLGTMAREDCLSFDERRIDDHPDDEDRYGIGASNSVVLRVREDDRPERWELVERPTEGMIYEALYRLREREGSLLWVARGAGEGDLEKTGDLGYSGLAAALTTEGYRVHQFVSSHVERIPDEVDAVVWIDPERTLRPEALEVLEAYLQRGGRLAAFIEPGRQTGLEVLLERWGLGSPNRVVVDPASGPVEGEAPGVNPLVYSYAPHHPVAQGLESSRMTFFRGARAFRLRKPQVADKIRGVAFTSPRAWLSPDLGILEQRARPVPPQDVETNFWPLVATGVYARGDRSTRVVAFGDSDLASNRHLRTLYNLDLVLNAIHWVSEDLPEITIRPKVAVSQRMQFALPLQNTLSRYQSLGLLLPELILILGALVWARSRSV